MTLNDVAAANAAIEAELSPALAKQGKRSAADRAVAYVLTNKTQVFHDQHGDAFMAFVNASNRLEVWSLRSKAAGEFIRWRFYQEEGKGLSGEAMTTARGTLAASARFQGPRVTWPYGSLRPKGPSGTTSGTGGQSR